MLFTLCVLVCVLSVRGFAPRVAGMSHIQTLGTNHLNKAESSRDLLMMSEASPSFGLCGSKSTHNPLNKVTSLFMTAIHDAAQPKKRLKRYAMPSQCACGFAPCPQSHTQLHTCTNSHLTPDSTLPIHHSPPSLPQT